jgi:hypothetical protein
MTASEPRSHQPPRLADQPPFGRLQEQRAKGSRRVRHLDASAVKGEPDMVGREGRALPGDLGQCIPCGLLPVRVGVVGGLVDARLPRSLDGRRC